MKFLCLHGAIGNPENFSVQLDPLIRELSNDGAAEFIFATGKVEVHPHSGFEEYFGPGPHYRFLDDGGLAEQAMLERVRDFPECGKSTILRLSILDALETRDRSEENSH